MKVVVESCSLLSLVAINHNESKLQPPYLSVIEPMQVNYNHQPPKW